MAKRRFPSVVVLMAVLFVVTFAAQPALADELDPLDPAISLGSTTTGSGTAQTYSWTYAPSVIDGTVYFQNTSGTTWTSLVIVAEYSTSGHTFDCRGSAFATCPDPDLTKTATTATFDYSGGQGVADGNYLSFQWINWNLNSGSSLPVFTFTANGGGPTDVPEPASMLLLGSGFLGLGGFFRRKKF